MEFTYNLLSIKFFLDLFITLGKNVESFRGWRSVNFNNKVVSFDVSLFSKASSFLHQIDKIKYIDPSCNTGQGVQQICEHSSDRKLSMRREIESRFSAGSFCPSGVRKRVYLLRPERWWTMDEEGEARRNSGGGSKWFWRANRSSNLSIGAKD